jgi:hypothetical protein
MHSFLLLNMTAQQENDSCYGIAPVSNSIVSTTFASLIHSRLFEDDFKLQHFYIGMELAKAMEMVAIRPASLADPSCLGIEPCLVSR